MRMFCCLFAVVFCCLIVGCSFKAERPAPVESLSSAIKPTHGKGSITATRYKVKAGDTLYSISWGANKDYALIARLNNLKKPYTIYPGQVLSLYSTHEVTNKKTANKTSKYIPRKVYSDAQTADNKDLNSAVNTQNTASTASKKQLDHVTMPAYSVTQGQQINNSVSHSKDIMLPKNVNQWSWPVNGKVIGVFSAKEQGNKGIKIDGRRGDAIKAAASGRVVYAGSALRGYGNLVIIKHSDDYLSAYAHADKILVKEKQVVNVGQTIAKMGNTGSNRVMLHFEIRYHGKSVNPIKFLPKK
ncbi:peptidoglycan DD-metalloendopeptidase family protein [Shewanella youngdeokensis]|uniref:Peptidoglycan DD-metalloendopeptidase family protein n=1 Tax=Shewanella youngdeokensis TaxID=2999068 RepID=A0ABZ0K0Q0_9GAMM|nr:peptidoglycan DD-metalloendopeptidase family protein [Shewanella sp. DAU334]